MVIDFGNSRTGALLVELTGEISQTPQMLPFELLNRYHLDAWNDAGEVRQRAGRAVVLLEDPLVQHALPAAAAAEEDRVSHRRRRGGPRRLVRPRQEGRARTRSK